MNWFSLKFFIIDFRKEILVIISSSGESEFVKESSFAFFIFFHSIKAFGNWRDFCNQKSPTPPRRRNLLIRIEEPWQYVSNVAHPENLIVPHTREATQPNQSETTTERKLKTEVSELKRKIRKKNEIKEIVKRGSAGVLCFLPSQMIQ